MTVGGAASVMPAEAARQTCRGARSHPTSRSPAVSLVVHAPQQDEEQHERDLAGCRVTATASRAGNYGLDASLTAEQTIEDCMRAKGWVPAR